MRKLFYFLCLLLVGFGSSGAARAQLDDDDIVTARSEGMAGAFRALAFDNAALDINPAGMAQYKRLSVDIGYRLDTRRDSSRFQVGVVDSLSSSIAGGAAYSFESADTPDSGTKARGQRVVSGFAFPLTERTYFGFNARYIRLIYPNDSERSNLRAFTADAGALVRPIEYLAIGLSANNIVDAGRPELSRNAGAGIAGLIPDGNGSPFIMAAFDVETDFGSTGRAEWGYAAGAQVAIANSVWLRAGYRVPPVSKIETMAFGFSYVGEQWGVDYALQRPTGGGSARHTVSLNLLVF